jgi:hypothetical protein
VTPARFSRSRNKYGTGLGETANLGHAPPMTPRYVIRPDRQGFSILDTATGQAAVIAMAPQSGLSEEDAAHTAALLNQRALQATGATAA